MKKIILIIIAATFIYSVNAQTWEWTHSEPNGNLDANSERDAAHDIEIDAAGNVYVLGDFTGSLYLSNNLAATGRGSYLAKYNSSGNLLWYKILVPANNSYDYNNQSIRATDLVVNVAGIFITGKYNPSIYGSFDCSTNTSSNFNPKSYSIGSLTFNSGYNDLGYFLTKLDTDGNIVWNKTGTSGSYCTNDGNNNYVYHSGGAIIYNPLLTSDVYNNVIASFICNSYVPTILIGSNVIPVIDAVNSISVQIVAVKFNSDGVSQWSNYASAGNAGYTGYADCNSITADNNGNIFLYGGTNEGTTFGSTVFHSTGTSGQSTFIAKLSSTGAWQFAKELGVNIRNILEGGEGTPDFLTTDNSNNIYALVGFGGTISTNSILGTLVPSDQTDSYLVKLDNDGNLIYKQGFASVGTYANSVHYANNSLYIAGGIRNTTAVSYGDRPWYFSNLTVKPSSADYGSSLEYFVSKANTDGIFQWATTFSSQSAITFGNAIKAYNDNVYTAGGNYAPVSTLGNLNGSATTSYNIFFGKLKDQYLRIGAVAPTSICPGASFSIPFTSYGLTFSATNTFTAQISNQLGAFTNAVNIGSVISTGSGSITATLPSNLALGTTGYRVRIVSSDLLATGFPYYVYADVPYVITVATQTYYADADGDGFGNPLVSIQTCTPPANYVLDNTDCDDTKAAVNPNTIWYLDADNDSYYTGSGITSCTSPGTGYKYAGLLGGNDCNDNNAAIHTAITYYRDADGDGFGATNITTTACSTTAPSGYVSNNTDCDDTKAAVNPNTIWYLDADNDNYYTGSGVTSCISPGTGYKYAGLLGGNDCNDNNAAINPGALEICGNGIDDNCNGQIDEGCTVTSTPSITINDITVYETQGTGVLTVTLSAISKLAVKVSFVTVDGTASSKGRYKDYTADRGTVTIPAGSLTATISLIIINDNILEGAEYFDVQLSKSSNATISKAAGRVTILDGAPPTTLISTKSVDASAIEETQHLLKKQSLYVQVSPNPSSAFFNLIVQSKSSQPISMRLLDVSGRIISTKSKINRNETMIVGTNFIAGTYFAEVIQGNNRKLVKLIKLN